MRITGSLRRRLVLGAAALGTAVALGQVAVVHLVIDATAVNVAPIHDPAAAVTLCADVSNVEHVLVAGQFVKRDFKLTGDLARAMSLVQSSRDYLAGAAADAAAAKQEPALA